MVFRSRQDNGVTVLLEPIEGVVSVSVGLWVKSGSRDERGDQLGYAHFIEHMLFKGTKQHPNSKDIALIVDRVGGHHNAGTDREYTCYYVNVVSDHLDLAVKLLAEMYYDSLFDTDELEKEKNVVMEEIRMIEDAPDELIFDVFYDCMLQGHPLGHTPLGTTEIIRTTTRESMLGFFEEQYRNDNIIVSIAGNFEKNAAESIVLNYFSRPCGKPAAAVGPPPPPARKEYHHIEKKDLEQVHFCLGADGITRVDEDRWALYILSTVMGGSMSSRLFQNIREKEGICYSIYSFHSSYSDSGVFGIYCATLPEKYNRAIELIVEECRDIVVSGITDQEFHDAKNFMKGNLALSLESVEVRMGWLAKNEITFGKNFTFGDIVESINRVTQEDIKRICDRVFGRKKLSVVSVGRLAGRKVPRSSIQL
jgi:predicted Zn-dependent peptidase